MLLQLLGLDKSGPARGFWGMYKGLQMPLLRHIRLTSNKNKVIRVKSVACRYGSKDARSKIAAKSFGRKRSLEQRLKNRKLGQDERNLGEKANYHNRLLDYKKNKNKDEIGNEFPLIRTDSAFDKVAKQANSSGSFLREVQNMKAKYDKLKQIMIDDGIDPTDPLAFNKEIMKTKDYFHHLVVQIKT